MKLPDANLLVYAHDRTSPFYDQAKEWLEDAIADQTETVGIAPVAALAFVRIITNPKLFKNPLSTAQACQVVSKWLTAGAILVHMGNEHFDSVEQLMAKTHGGVNLLTDAHLAALAMEHKAVLYSNDRDFQRFSGLKLRNPIGEQSQR